jgi:hypothetical protein
MTSKMLGDSTLESLTPSVNAPLVLKEDYFGKKLEEKKSSISNIRRVRNCAQYFVYMQLIK